MPFSIMWFLISSVFVEASPISAWLIFAPLILLQFLATVLPAALAHDSFSRLGYSASTSPLKRQFPPLRMSSSFPDHSLLTYGGISSFAFLKSANWCCVDKHSPSHSWLFMQASI